MISLFLANEYTVDRFFFTVLIPKQLCEDAGTGPAERAGCAALAHRLEQEFDEAKQFIVTEEENVFEVTQRINATNFSFRVDF